MADYYQTKKGTTLEEILKYAASSNERVIYIGFPPRSYLLQSKAIKILKKAGSELDKRFVIVAGGKTTRERIESLGLKTVSPQVLFKNRNSSEKVKKDKTKNSPDKWIASKNNQDTKPFLGKKRIFLFVGSALFALIAGFLAANFLLQQANITVFARTQDNQNNFDLTVSENYNQENAVEVFYVEEIAGVNDTFEATGEKFIGDKAIGEVIIKSSFNNTLLLKATTTYLESSEGKIYYPTTDIQGLRPNVPYTVEVVAAEAGSSFNLPAGERLEVHNRVFGHRPQILYAVVDGEGIEGGQAEELTVISEADVSKSIDQLKIKVLDQLQEKYAKQYGKELIILPELSKIKILEQNSDGSLGDNKQNFTVSMSVETKALAFWKEDLNKLVLKNAKEQNMVNQSLVEVLNDYSYNVRSHDLEQKIAIIRIDYKYKTRASLNEDVLKNMLAGKSIYEIKHVLLSKPEIAGVQVNLSPFWLSKTPNSPNRIKINFESQ